MPVQPTAVIDRIYRRIKVHPLGCWEWQGALQGAGYGAVQLGRGIGTSTVHRVVYEEEVGPIPAGLTIDHLCANTRCCNPAHLEVVTRAENARRQWRDGRADPGRSNRELTHCKHGHPFDAHNTYLDKRGSRCCRTCKRERARLRDPEAGREAAHRYRLKNRDLINERKRLARQAKREAP